MRNQGAWVSFRCCLKMVWKNCQFSLLCYRSWRKCRFLAYSTECVDLRLIICQDWVTEVHNRINFSTGKNWPEFWVTAGLFLSAWVHPVIQGRWYQNMIHKHLLSEECYQILWWCPIPSWAKSVLFTWIFQKLNMPRFFAWMRCAHSGCGTFPCFCCVPIISGLFNILTRTSVDIVGKVKHLGLSKTLYLAPRCSLKTFCCQI